MSDDGLMTWGSDEQKQRVFSEYSEALDTHYGTQSSTGSRQYQTFIDIETNRSVRPQYGKSDYYSFRPGESVPNKQKHAIKMCMDAYQKVGIVRNIIDLMGDFGCQGIDIVHENESVQKFYKQWFKKVNAKERSERFLNNLYRAGNVICHKSYANITPNIKKYMKSMGSDVLVSEPSFLKGVIPWKYVFFNPLMLDIKQGNVYLKYSREKYPINNGKFIDSFESSNMPEEVKKTLPEEVRRAIDNNEREIKLEDSRLYFAYYKKDDWDQWANPLIHAILDDIIMLEKMRLADMSALDGAISNIRLWNIGDLDHKIAPNKKVINKLRDILASNVGGGTMDLVWGPELKFTESNSQVYKFLGSEKYNSVLSSIYAGLGVPPTLTGMAGQSGGFTNNFISLKTLVERLQYGRDQLTKFWEGEIEIVRKAMGFRKPAHVTYDQMSLSDDSTEKNLLIQLLDRNVISDETVLERFREIPAVEKMRIRKESKLRDSDRIPDKAGPFHNPNQKADLEKMEKQAELNDKSAEKQAKIKETDNKVSNPKQKGPQVKNGRPSGKQDTKPRKTRTETPKSKPGVAELINWTNKSYKAVSQILNNGYLSILGRNDLRSLTKSQSKELEEMKLHVLSNIDVMSEVTEGSILESVQSMKKMPKEYAELLQSNKIDIDNMKLDTFRKQAISCYTDYILSK